MMMIIIMKLKSSSLQDNKPPVQHANGLTLQNQTQKTNFKQTQKQRLLNYYFLLPTGFPTVLFNLLFRQLMIWPRTEYQPKFKSKPCPLRSGWSRCTTWRWWPGRNRRWGADRCGRAGSRGHIPRGTTVPAARFPSASRWGGLGGHPGTDRSVAVQA